MPTIYPDETLDRLSKFGLKIIQKKESQRTTNDAIQLADFSLMSRARGRAVDLGTGNGAISLILSTCPQIENVVGLELQTELAELAQRNVYLNGFEDKIKICQGDWCQIKKVLKGEKFELVVANPPYWKSDSGRINPASKRAYARHEMSGTLEDLVSACRYLVKPKGYVNLIYPVQRLVELIILLENYQLQPKQLQFIHYNLNSQARLFLIRASLNGQQGVEVLPPVTFSPPRSKLRGIKTLIPE